MKTKKALKIIEKQAAKHNGVYELSLFKKCLLDTTLSNGRKIIFVDDLRMMYTDSSGEEYSILELMKKKINNKIKIKNENYVRKKES